MSIYSGFATRNQQQFYDKILYNLLSTLLVRISKFYKGEEVDDNVFLKIVYEQQRCLRKMEKRKYLEPKYSDLLTQFKHNINTEQQQQTVMRRGNHNHQLNRTLSHLGKQFGQLRARADKQYKNETVEVADNQSLQKLITIQERKKGGVSKKKKKQKKTSIKSNIDIWDIRQQKSPELPNLNPNMHRTIMSKTKFNNFSEKMKSKQIENEDHQQQNSLRNVLRKPPKFRAKLYFN